MASSIFFFLAISLTMLNTAFSTHYSQTLQKQQQEGNKFGYIGGTGPNMWGSLSPNFSLCSHGKAQSPIDVVTHKAFLDKNLKPLIRVYHASNATLVDNGFNVGIRFNGNVGGFSIDGKKYTLLQMHWHSPSEHRLNGRLMDAELHIVHKAEDGSIAVVAVLYKDGDADPLLTKIQSKLAELTYDRYAKREEGPEIVLGTFNTKQMRRKSHKYYRYRGSFTTPPCTENISWNILGKVRSISKQQVDALRGPLDIACKRNARPVQPLNGRVIELYDEDQ
ncbi:alpha carbonic anhydrase 1, chloroplastic-like [Apium graveolens]|uniref:alpha carbonic anhydrase 1, chloroplastic-like n=1 Tax=Apium graveolens TaxID=4045 RepID=UPI003D7B47D7